MEFSDFLYWGLALVSTSSLICFLAVLILAIQRPHKLCKEYPALNENKQDAVLMIGFGICSLILGYAGSQAAFFWLPDSISDEKGGDFISLKNFISILCSFLFAGLFSNIYQFAKDKVSLTIKEIEVSHLREICLANKSELIKMTEEYEEKLKHYKTQDSWPQRKAFQHLREISLTRIEQLEDTKD